MATLDDQLQAEIATLKARVATLENTLSEVSRERDELRGAVIQMPALFAILRGKEHVISFANPPWKDAILGPGGREVTGKTIREALPEISGQGFYELLDQVFETGETYAGRFIPADLDRSGTGELERRYHNFHYIAHRGVDGEIRGIVVHSHDVTSEFLARQEVQELNAKLSTFFALAENATDGITLTTDDKITYANPAFRRMVDEACLGKSHTDLITEESRVALREAAETSSAGEAWQVMLTYRRPDGSTFPGQLSSFAIQDEQGEIRAVGSILRDQRRSEQERAALREEVILAQERAIRELSSPLIPLAQGLVLMPLLGTIDASRANQIMETLLAGIAAQRAQIAILDVTGVKNVDTAVANALIRTAQAANLLGTEVVLTGIGPDVARILVELGANLGSVKTRGTLQSAIAYALGTRTPSSA
ncbi:PAS domain-containing protein [Chondromyces apiculatus]|uniref:Putative PAS/PAC sensor protein n=1 Tax=Chondromyces apiculatus DSM 436 TaxID=1192034 RepID=A0A017TB32_9BACT|nr:PAS domain-containing protein [Chondromyces apiculatus]EYF06097.1 putative PAS/PAC sensor protein [Chondromyces apiculatus DSM 436]